MNSTVRNVSLFCNRKTARVVSLTLFFFFLIEHLLITVLSPEALNGTGKHFPDLKASYSLGLRKGMYK